MKTIPYKVTIALISLGALLLNSCDNKLDKDMDTTPPSPTVDTHGIQFSSQLGGSGLKGSPQGESNSWGHRVEVGTVRLGVDGKQSFTASNSTRLKTSQVAGGATYWTNADSIGIYMVQAGEGVSTGSIFSGADNVPYNASPVGDGSSATFSPAKDTIYYPHDDTNSVNFVSYYPYNATVSNDYKYPIDLSDQSDVISMGAFDLLYSSEGVAYNKGSGAVSLGFKHVLSKVVFNISAGSATTNLTGLTVSIDSVYADGNFDLSTGGVSLGKQTSEMTAKTSADGFLAEAMILPQDLGSAVVRFQVSGGKELSWRFNGSNLTKFEAGTQYVFNIQLKPVDIPDGLVYVAPGTFWMGSPGDEVGRRENETRHQVTLTNGYYIGKYAVTYDEYDTYCDATSTPKPKANNGRGKHPVTYVSWNDAQAYCVWLNSLPVNAGRTYRLPTEAEWEFACRGGVKSEGYLYSGSNDLSAVAWWKGNCGTIAVMKEVGLLAGNELGLYDMNGNAWEWCNDWYLSNYGVDLNATTENPKGPDSAVQRVCRGGYYWDSSTTCRAAGIRSSNVPFNNYFYVGFRVVCDIN